MRQSNDLEDILRKNFQRKITFLIDGAEYKTGKFLLYRVTLYSNNYYVEFILQTNKKIDTIKIPFPFNIEDHPDEQLVYFDYRLKTLCKNDKKIAKKLSDFSKSQEGYASNKFFDKILEIQFE